MADPWFPGPIADAVRTVTQNNLILLVFIYNDSEESRQLEANLVEQKTTSVIKEKTVALKMQKNSEDAKMFSQLYPISKVPIVYFILQGTIKDFSIQDMTGDQIVDKINRISSTSISPVNNTSTSNNSSSSDQDKEGLEEMSRKKRIKDEKKRERENEIKRREEGKFSQETKQRLQEEQNKIYLEKAKREKREDEEYKRKVKEQIVKDRENQIAARKAEKQRLQLETANKRELTSSAAAESSMSYYDHSNLNIKQLDGSSLRHNFSSSDTLTSVSQWIDSVRTDGDMPFKLFAQFPNRNFDIGDERRTLLELKLCPSATLIMKPIKNASTAYSGAAAASSNSASDGGWMNYLYSAGDAVYNTVSSVGTSVASYLVVPINAAPEPGQRLGGGGVGFSSNASSPTTLSPRRSNINTLNSVRYKKDDDDDEKQTYNGNSVNQE